MWVIIMTVTVKVLSISGLTVTVEAIDNKTGNRIVKTPIRIKTATKKNIESVLKKELKAFNSAVWQGFNIEFLVNIE